MSIKSDADLKKAIEKANYYLQEIQDYMGRRKFTPDGKVRFPRGFIRTASSQRARLEFIDDPILKKNLSYTLMLSDVYHWLLARTDLSGTAKEMVIKAGLFLAGALSESIIKEVLKGKIGKKSSYKERTQKLLNLKIIDHQLKTELDWLWDMRNNQHLFSVPHSEYDRYSGKDYNRAVVALNQLFSCLED